MCNFIVSHTFAALETIEIFNILYLGAHKYNLEK